MSNPLQISKAFGAAGTVALHILIFFHAFVFKYSRYITKPLPPPEPLRIELTEASAASFQPPQLVPQIPETKAPLQETTIPDIVSPVQKTPMLSESSASNLPEVQSKPAQFVEPFPERASAPATAHRPEQGRESGTQKIEEAKQAVLSSLIAGLEREKRYPTAARRLGIEGQVTASVHLDSQGRIISASVKRNESEPMLERATVEALERVQKKWNPMPLPEPMILNIPIRYNLNK